MRLLHVDGCSTPNSRQLISSSPKWKTDVCGRERLVELEVAFDDVGGIEKPEAEWIAAATLIKPSPGRSRHV